MPRLDIVTKENATGKQKELLESIEKAKGRVPNILASMAQSPVVLEFYLQSSAILANCKLDAKTREAIALACASANSCDYCSAAHTAIGKGVGMSKDQISSALKAESDDSKIAAILTFTKKVVEQNAEMSDGDVEALTSAGVSQEELTELIAVIGINMFTNYFNHINQTVVDF